MAKKIIFQDSFLVSGIMCFVGCGEIIQCFLNDCLEECVKSNLLPAGAQLVMDAEPQTLGIHRIFITVIYDGQEITLDAASKKIISTQFKASLLGFIIIDEGKKE